jgi:hypothetical protein
MKSYQNIVHTHLIAVSRILPLDLSNLLTSVFRVAMSVLSSDTSVCNVDTFVSNLDKLVSTFETLSDIFFRSSSFLSILFKPNISRKKYFGGQGHRHTRFWATRGMLRLMKQIEELKWIFIVACICFLQSDRLKKEANTEYPPYDPDRHQSCQDMTSQM